MAEFTVILDKARQGDPKAAADLWALVYSELRRLAAQKLRSEPIGQTLQATDLVHEVWLRLGGDREQSWKNRAHFFGAAAEAMRRILVERARKRRAVKHGGGLKRIDLNGIEIPAPAQDDLVLAIHEVLGRFAEVEPEKAELVKLRFFGGLTIEECAALLDISEATVVRWWEYAGAWLRVECKKDGLSPKNLPSQ